MIRIDLPTDEETIRRLNVGDEVSIFGTIVTARDAAHKLMVEQWPQFVDPLVRNGAIYHCGPVVKSVDGQWKTISAGPTTSRREEPYQAKVMQHYGVRIIIGKGGMGKRTLAACEKLGAVYVNVTGGAASLIAQRIVKTKDVHLLQKLGGPEAFWVFEVEKFEGVVSMDSKGNSLPETVLNNSRQKLNGLIGLK